MKFRVTSHISTMICLEIKNNNSKKNKAINLTKIYKAAIFNLKKFDFKSVRYKKEIYDGMHLR